MIETLIEQLRAHKFDTSANVEIVHIADPAMRVIVHDGIAIERGYRKLEVAYHGAPPDDPRILLEEVLKECVREIQHDLWKYVNADRYIFALHNVIERPGMSPITMNWSTGFGISYGKYCN